MEAAVIEIKVENKWAANESESEPRTAGAGRVFAINHPGPAEQIELNHWAN